MMKKTYLLVAVLCLLVSSFAFGDGGDMGVSTEPLTNGSAVYPYLIEDFADFQVFADPCNSATYWASGVHTKLMVDIDLDPALVGRQTYTTAIIAPDISNLNEIFDGTVFSGTFRGNGHTITNLTIDTAGADNDYLGLFGKIDALLLVTEITNLGIEDCNITGGNDSIYLGGLCGFSIFSHFRDCYTTGTVRGKLVTGGLIGFNFTSTIDNCYTSGSVIGGDNSENLGGLCGYNFNGDITNCYTNGSVTGGEHSDYIGGLCGGQSETGSITNCYATGAVTGGNDTWSVGGLCGGGTGTISNCYATGAVAGGNNSERLGGLIGENGDSDLINSDGNVLNCYATGTVTGGSGSSNLGGLCGYQYGSNAEISNSFWDTETSGMATGYNLDGTYPGTITNVVGKITNQMQTQSTFTTAPASWDFVSTWWINDERDYPKLDWQPFGDLNNDNHVNLYDFAIMSAAWQASDGDENYNSVCELSGDITIDEADLAELAGMWLAGPSW